MWALGRARVSVSRDFLWVGGLTNRVFTTALGSLFTTAQHNIVSCSKKIFKTCLGLSTIYFIIIFFRCFHRLILKILSLSMFSVIAIIFTWSYYPRVKFLSFFFLFVILSGLSSLSHHQLIFSFSLFSLSCCSPFHVHFKFISLDIYISSFGKKWSESLNYY